MKKLLILLLPLALTAQVDSLKNENYSKPTFDASISKKKEIIWVDTLKTRTFRFTPLPKSTNKINGMAMGLGLSIVDERPLTVNGFNLELNPIAPLAVLFVDPDPTKRENDSLTATVNGLNISTLGFVKNAKINGVGIAPLNVGIESNGFFITPLYHSAKKMNGLFVSGFGNWSVESGGLPWHL